MEMSARKLNILSAVVRQYIETGEPVGSKALTELFLPAISSATLRSEMSELCQMGFLNQPHTSAGRVPTVSGYRFYLDRLLTPHRLSERDRAFLRSLIPSGIYSVRELMDATAEAVAETTNCAAVAATPLNDAAHVYKVEAIPVNRQAAMVVLITDNGQVKSRSCYIPETFGGDHFTLFNRFSEAAFSRKPLSDITPVEIQRLAASLPQAMAFAPLLAAVLELARDAAEAEIHTLKESNLFSYRESDTAAAHLLRDLIRQSSEILSMLAAGNRAPDVLMGAETGVSELRPYALILSGFAMGSRAGKIGVIGPARMPYEEIIPKLEFFSALLSDKISELEGQ